MVGEPAVIPVTTPEEFTEPTAALLLLQVPPTDDSVRLVVEPVHTVELPVMVLGVG